LAILRLIGATTTFIRVPYLLEGAVLGALGSAVSLIMLKVVYEVFRQQVSMMGRLAGLEQMVTFFSPQICVALIVVGMALGCAGSFVSLRRFGEAKV
jgi:cell division transport system permease protein